ncbi:hypothetical protein [Novosphingopyxis baekryungensis]|uniref:hypothetical protein n=1 Tax=Novosphingopyxis baekryungensis TaxID=279369 RepID=UPI0003B47635|nr:hypothetical protein [Novosphingopyxis baekryungensis]
MRDDYKVTDRAYLARCRGWIIEGRKAGLFYAAFELKCFLEAKLGEYLENWEGRPLKKVQVHRIKDNVKSLAKQNTMPDIVRMVFTNEIGLSETYFHTPVPVPLIDYATKTLDGLRHAQTRYRKPDDIWWQETRNALIENYRRAWFASRGTAPVPPLWRPEDGRGEMPFTFLFPDDEPPSQLFEDSKPGDSYNVEISYLDEPPRDWVCDL